MPADNKLRAVQNRRLRENVRGRSCLNFGFRLAVFTNPGTRTRGKLIAEEITDFVPQILFPIVKAFEKTGIIDLLLARYGASEIVRVIEPLEK